MATTQAWPKLCANWVLGEVAAACNRHGKTFEAAAVPPVLLAALLIRSEDGSIAAKTARALFANLWEQSLAHEPAAAFSFDRLEQALDYLDSLIDRQSLRQLNDDAALTAIVDQVLAANPKSVAEYRAGKEKALNALVGQVMKASAGKANPAQVNQLLRDRVQP
jgi:aspartyl-tRNA(Asn)/glutamyl-tRNA(Gln) amidotransferase subunit B